MEKKKIGHYDVFFFDELTSTMDVAREMIDYGCEYAVVAKVQTDGRGRHGRKWISNEGGLWISIVWKHVDKNLLKYMFLVVAKSIVETLKNFGISSRIKLPNDIYAENRKISGILIENLRACVIIGIGINVNNDLDEEMGDATSCRNIIGCTLNLDSVLNLTIENLDKSRSCFVSDNDEFFNEIKGLLIK
jgi:BirA family biotin operon repressor/biotin-[acetyl-CoA-carboxylase] ligase